MKVGFISPRGSESNQGNSLLSNIYLKLHNILNFVEIEDIEFMPNLGLLTVAGQFPSDWELKYIDEDYIEPGTADVLDFDEKFDLVCLTAVNSQASRAYAIADEFRKRGTRVAIGGMHVSALPEEGARHADVVIVGEGEDVCPKLVEDLRRGQLQRIYRSHGNVDLTTVGAPRLDLVNRWERFNKVPLQATRGCPRGCKYCSIITTYGKKYRHKSVEQIVAEVEMAKRLHSRPWISFADENLYLDRKFTRALARALKPLNVRWECYCDSNVAEDEELLELLHESNCVQIMIGFESLNADSLATAAPWKSRKVDGYAECVHKIQSHGIGVMGLFIVGLDSDDTSVFPKLRDFIDETNMFDADFAILCPIVGTPLFDDLKAQGRIVSENWDDYAWYHVNYKPMKMTAQELQDGILWLFQEYNSPPRVWKRIEFFRQVFERLHGKHAALEQKLEKLGLAHYLHRPDYQRVS
ncbi:MAG: B12-binding domain-containing radical SAM protein [Armatimonadetes bacterium]|nr:B12-binding domain-containing radical SAM protein [Armatimonadota bacterium]